MNLPWSRSHFAPSATSTQRLRCVTFDGVYDGSPGLAMPSTQPPTALALAVAALPHGAAAALAGEIGIVPEASHRGIAPAACSGRVKGQNPRSDARIALLCDSGCSDRNTCDFVSHVRHTSTQAVPTTHTNRLQGECAGVRHRGPARLQAFALPKPTRAFNRLSRKGGASTTAERFALCKGRPAPETECEPPAWTSGVRLMNACVSGDYVQVSGPHGGFSGRNSSS
jgi:hypothetical protein